MATVNLDQSAKNNEMILFAVILAVSVYGIFTYIYVPAAETIRSRNVEVEKALTERARLEKQLDSFNKKQAGATPSAAPIKTLGDQTSIKAKVLSGDIQATFPDFPSMLPTLLSQDFCAGMQLNDIGIKPPQQQKDFSQTDITLKYSGSFRNLIKCLGSLEDFPATFTVEKLSLSNGGQGYRAVNSEVMLSFYQLNKALNGFSFEEELDEASGPPAKEANKPDEKATDDKKSK